MFRTAGRALLRGTAGGGSIPTVTAAGRRTLFATAKKSGPGPKTLKSSALRWGLAIGGTYYYMTSSVFAEESTYFKQGTHPIVAVTEEDDDEDLTKPRSHRELDDIRLSSRTTGAVSDAEDSKLVTADEAGTTKRHGSPEETDGRDAVASFPEELEEEADQQGAFNPETGEINWDCPCLGGMAHGPCGEEFKTAFSCFVYSEAEPKGVDCIDKFKGMQDCFRKFPEHYGAELDPEDEEGGKDELAQAATADDKYYPEHFPANPEPAVPLTTAQVQEKVRTEVPAVVESD